MQPTEALQEGSRPPQPDPTWKWADRLGKWIPPQASPRSGYLLPESVRFKKGDPKVAELGTQGGIISAKARAKLAASDEAIDKIVSRWIRDAQRGDNRAREQLLDRLEGKVAQEIKAELTSRYVIEEVGVDSVDINAETPELPGVSEGGGG